MRPIDADALKEVFERYRAAPHVNVKDNTLAYGLRMGIEGCTTFLDNAPTIDVEPVRRGEWVTRPNGIVECSLCGCIAMSDCDFKVYVPSPYCPNCGATMKGFDHEKENKNNL